MNLLPEARSLRGSQVHRDAHPIKSHKMEPSLIMGPDLSLVSRRWNHEVISPSDAYTNIDETPIKRIKIERVQQSLDYWNILCDLLVLET